MLLIKNTKIIMIFKENYKILQEYSCNINQNIRLY